jgi:acetoin utilization deacetylase AcuC-like enzyme
MRTAYLTDPACARHEMMAGHPESPARLAAIHDRLLICGVLDAVMKIDQVVPAARADLLAAHTPQHLDQIAANLPDTGYAEFDPDTLANRYTGQAMLHAAGAAVMATEMVLAGQVDNAFCAIRPPGHHATRSAVMGFCFINNVAVAARVALGRGGLDRVAIIDFDVHRGNGTEDIFSDDERVLMVGLYQHPLYPYSDQPPCCANTVCTPLPAGADGAALRTAVEQTWLPALEQFRPQMLFISAGFDAHQEDPLGGMALRTEDYRWVTERLLEVASRHANGRVVSVLEGGYDLSALARSVEVHLRALAGL